MSHYINKKKVASSPMSIPENAVFRGNHKEVGEGQDFVVDRAHALSSFAGSSIQPVFINSEGKPEAISFIPADSNNIYNENMLINPYFVNPINTSGMDTWIGNGNCIDGWRLQDSNIEAKLVNGGLKLTQLGGTSTTFGQALNYDLSQLKGKTVTVSIKANGEVYQNTVTLKDLEKDQTYEGDNLSLGVYGVYFDLYRNRTQNYLSARIILANVGATITIEWIKLEIGSVSTTFMPPRYADEWDRCLRFNGFSAYAGPAYSNTNLILNPDFKINQRGSTEYVSGYCVDRWAYSNSITGNKLTVVSEGISLPTADTQTARPFLRQYIEPETINPGIHTLSISVDGKVYSTTGLLTKNDTMFVNELTHIGIQVGINYETSVKAYRVYIQPVSPIGKNYVINWVKLESGYVRTAFTAPDPALELIKCRRYYKVLKPARVLGTSFNGTDNLLQFTINDCIGDMRVIPTVTLKGTQASYVNQLDGKIWIQFNGNMVEEVTRSAGTSYTPAVVEDSIVISALIPTATITLTHPNHTLVFSSNTGIICDAEIN